MTISSTYSPVQYTGNGVTTVFAFPYEFYDSTDLVVKSTVISTGVTTTLTSPTDYSVSGGAGSTGNVTFVSAPASTVRITIERSIPYTQGQDYQENTAFPAATIETGFDKSVIMAQQTKSLTDYALKFETTDPASSIGTIPSSVVRANSILSFDAAGKPSAVAIASLGDIDVSLTSPQTNDCLVYNAGVWNNKSIGNITAAATTATPVSTDLIPFGDVSDSNNTKKTTIQGILDLVFSSGGIGISNNGYAANRYYFGGIGYPGSTVTVTANRLYTNVFIVGSPKTFTRIGIEVTTLSAGNARLGIYNFANGVPTTLVADLGTVSTGTTGLKEVTINQSLSAGVYCLACVFDATPTLRGIALHSGISLHMYGTDSPGINDPAQCYTSFTYGALPSTFGALTYTNNATFLMWLRAV